MEIILKSELSVPLRQGLQKLMAMAIMVNFPSELMDLFFLDMEISLVLLLD